MQYSLLKPWLISYLIVYACSASGAELIDNGDFESSKLTPWKILSVEQPRTGIFSSQPCVGGYDSSGIITHGKQAAMLTGPSENSTHATVLRSQTFTAGNGLAFIALAAYPEGPGGENTSDLRVDILDAKNNQAVVTQHLSPRSIRLTPACEDETIEKQRPEDQFSAHYFSTQAYAGLNIKLQFSISDRSDLSPLFILIDQVVNFQQSEKLMFSSRPYAQAGTGMSPGGIPYLTSKGSFDPDAKPDTLSYTWYLEGAEYHQPNPCLPAHYEGNFHAVLYINDGHHAMSDDISFYLADSSKYPASMLEYECDSPRQEPELPANAIDMSPTQASTALSTKEPGLSDEAGPENEIKTAVMDWVTAWSTQDVDKYVNAYIQDYSGNKNNSEDWAVERRRNIKSKEFINVALSDIQIERIGDQYHAGFIQQYQSNNYSDVVKKKLVFVQRDGEWKIEKEL